MNYKNLLFIPAFALLVFGCNKNNDPVKEDVPELITKVTLTFVPSSGSPVIVTATDPDGDGIQNIEQDGAINLAKLTTYSMSIQLINGLADPASDEYNVTNEVETEGDEHMFFFSWVANTFESPAGDGNVDNRSDAVDYSLSMDANGLPLGLTTKWKTADLTATDGTFRVLLKHQPGLKSATSKSTDGETDLDITFELNVN
jgi:hypothetical protein